MSDYPITPSVPQTKERSLGQFALCLLYIGAIAILWAIAPRRTLVVEDLTNPASMTIAMPERD